MSISVASNLPEELFRDVLLYLLLGDHKAPPDFTGRSQEVKQQVSAYTLTCVDWAKQCRPFRLRAVTLRSAEDVRMLRYFATSPPSAQFEPITRYTTQVLIRTDLDGPPWIHHIYPLLRLLGHRFLPEREYYSHTPAFPSILDGYALSRKQHLFTLSLGFERPSHRDATTTPDPWPYSSIHYGLPRTLPACYHALFGVTLDNLHWRSLASLLRLVKELEGVRMLGLRYVTWDSDGSSSLQLPDPVCFPAYGKNEYLGVNAYQCTDNALAVVIPFYQPRWRYSPKSHLSVAREDMQIVIRATDWAYASYRGLEPTEQRLVVFVRWDIIRQDGKFCFVG